MARQLDRVASKLKSYRFFSGDERKIASDEIYEMIFDQEDLYQHIWDESILLAISNLTTEYPPAHLYSPEVEFIQKRTALVVVINDLFARLLGHETEEFSVLLERIANRLDIDVQTLSPAADIPLSDISQSTSEPDEKLRMAVEELSRLNPLTVEALTGCLSALMARHERGLVASLLITERERIGGVLNARALLRSGVGRVNHGTVGEEIFNKAVDRARLALVSLGFLSDNHEVDFNVEKTDAKYSGSSIALAAAMAMYSYANGFKFDCFTAFTGDLAIEDTKYRVMPVEGIVEKLEAAKMSGIRRVVLPRRNEGDVPQNCELEVVLVDDIKEVLNRLALRQILVQDDNPQQRKSLIVRYFCTQKGWQLSERNIPRGLQFVISPPSSKPLIVSIYDTGTHTFNDKQKAEYEELIQKLDACDSPETPLQKVEGRFTIQDANLRREIRDRFESLQPSQRRDEQYCDYFFKFENGKENLVVKQYTKGTLQLQGYAGPLYRKALEIIIHQYNLHYPHAALSIEDYLPIEPLAINLPKNASEPTNETVELPYIGTDESGKGDYFGPLVIAAVWVDEQLSNSLAKLGVRDSKKLTDRQCRELAARIRDLCLGKYHVVEILPDKYNQLHQQFEQEKKNLNHLLAWGHARAIESLVSRENCNQAIADQFGDEKYIRSKLMEKGKNLKLLQTPKAERFIAVAAASVLARDQFLSRLGQLSNEAGVTLPKGASPAVVEAAKQIVQKHGVESLRRFAKLHFKTTASVLKER